MGEPGDLTDERFAEALETLARQNVPGVGAGRCDAGYRAELGAELGREHTAARPWRRSVGRAVPAAQQSPARGAGSGIRRTYSYLFTWPSPTVPGLGSCHTMDLPFVFRQLDHAENVPLVGDEPHVNAERQR